MAHVGEDVVEPVLEDAGGFPIRGIGAEGVDTIEEDGGEDGGCGEGGEDAEGP